MRVIRTSVVHKSKHETTGAKCVNGYVKVGECGRGSFGKVLLCRSAENGRLYAVKVLNKRVLSKIRQTCGRSALDCVWNEIAVLEHLPPHPNVARLVEVMDDPTCDKVYLVFEHLLPLPHAAAQGTMQSAAGGHEEGAAATPAVSDEACLELAVQCARALAHLHEHGVIHLDVKLDHLMRGEKGVVKLIDFGASELCPPSREPMDSVVRSPGTPAYTAPECCTGGAYGGRKADVWALGVCLYVLRYGRFPFTSRAASDMYEEVGSAAQIELPRRSARGASGVLTAVMEGALAREPARRLSAEGILAVIRGEGAGGLGCRSVQEIEQNFASRVLGKQQVAARRDT